MDIYRNEWKICSSEADMHRRIRLSALFTRLQEAAIEHTQQLGAGREKTLDKGLLWVVTQQSVSFARMPEYDECLTLLSWPGKTMHLFFPRFWQILDERGDIIIEASSLWGLMDAHTRKLTFPEEYGIDLPDLSEGRSIPLPTRIRAQQAEIVQSFTVPYSYVDLNGHMNNARYLDVAENVMPEALRARRIGRVTAEYAAEIRPEETVSLETGADENAFYMACMKDGKRLFRLRFDYQEGKSET